MAIRAISVLILRINIFFSIEVENFLFWGGEENFGEEIIYTQAKC